MAQIKFTPIEEERKYRSPETIFHYTSIAGLMGIITNDELWFSRFDCLNDVQEGIYVHKPYQKAISELQGEVDDSFLKIMAQFAPNYKDFFRISPVEKDGSYLVTPKDSIPYLCCFSAESDSLPMWNYYSKSGRYEGYNIEFDWKKIKEEHKELEALCVIYEEHDQIAILKNMIKEALENYKDNELQWIWLYYTRELMTRALEFKNPAYRHENEVRMVYKRPEDDDGLAEKALELAFRQTQGLVIPYVKIKGVKEAIKSVTIGPLIKQDVAENTLNCLLKSKGITVPIKQSEIPIRY